MTKLVDPKCLRFFITCTIGPLPLFIRIPRSLEQRLRILCWCLEKLATPPVIYADNKEALKYLHGIDTSSWIKQTKRLKRKL